MKNTCVSMNTELEKIFRNLNHTWTYTSPSYKTDFSINKSLIKSKKRTYSSI